MAAPLKANKQSEYRLSMNLNSEIYKFIRTIAEEKSLSLSGIMRSLIKAEMKRHSHVQRT
jgi:hypothetical protein